MIQFFDVDKDYIDWLKTIDSKIPNIVYTRNDKFVCGVILKINGFEYYAPVSHNPKVFRTSYPIKNKQGVVISTVRPCFMFPANKSVLEVIDFSEKRKIDEKYADLLELEVSYCNRHEQELKTKVHWVYQVGLNKKHKFNDTCCDFLKLEKAFSEKYG